MEIHAPFTEKNAPNTGYTFGTGSVRVRYVLYTYKVRTLQTWSKVAKKPIMFHQFTLKSSLSPTKREQVR